MWSHCLGPQQLHTTFAFCIILLPLCPPSIPFLSSFSHSPPFLFYLSFPWDRCVIKTHYDHCWRHVKGAVQWLSELCWMVPIIFYWFSWLWVWQCLPASGDSKEELCCTIVSVTLQTINNSVLGWVIHVLYHQFHTCMYSRAHCSIYSSVWICQHPLAYLQPPSPSLLSEDIYFVYSWPEMSLRYFCPNFSKDGTKLKVETPWVTSK